jgi:hypothetical protein
VTLELAPTDFSGLGVKVEDPGPPRLDFLVISCIKASCQPLSSPNKSVSKQEEQAGASKNGS